jgi:hypothetical protein
MDAKAPNRPRRKWLLIGCGCLAAVIFFLFIAVGTGYLVIRDLQEERLVWTADSGVQTPDSFIYLAFPADSKVQAVPTSPGLPPVRVDRAVMIGHDELRSGEPFELWLRDQSGHIDRAGMTFIPLTDSEARSLIDSYNVFIAAHQSEYGYRRIECSWTRDQDGVATVRLEVVDTRGRSTIYIYQVGEDDEPVAKQVRFAL